MVALTFPTDTETILPDSREEFRIVIIYEDAAAGFHAKRVTDKLLHEIGKDCEPIRNFWNFDVLNIRDVRNASLSVAGAANLVIVSASGERELPAEVEEWLEMWSWLLNDSNGAVTALFNNAAGRGAASICRTLHRISAGRNVEVFIAQGIPEEAVEA